MGGNRDADGWPADPERTGRITGARLGEPVFAGFLRQFGLVGFARLVGKAFRAFLLVRVVQIWLVPVVIAGPLGRWLAPHAALVAALFALPFVLPILMTAAPWGFRNVLAVLTYRWANLLDRLIALSGRTYYVSFQEVALRQLLTVGLVGVAGALFLFRRPSLWRALLTQPMPGSLTAFAAEAGQALVLCLVHTAALTLFLQAVNQALFVWKDLSGGAFVAAGPRLRDLGVPTLALEAAAVSPPSVRIAHWSDLHITAAPETRRTEGGLGGNRMLAHAVSALPHDADVLLVTGDITDAGLWQEWDAFFEIVPASALQNMVVLPGNHDLNILDPRLGPEDPHGFLVSHGPQAPGRSLRLYRFLRAVDRIQGARAKVWPRSEAGPTHYRGHSREEIGRGAAIDLAFDERRFKVQPRALRDYLEERRPLIEAFVADPVEKALDMRRLWSSIFPMAVEFPEKRFVLFLLDSNDESSYVVTNAFGMLTEADVKFVKEGRPHYAGWMCIVALHHHIALPPPGTSVKRIQARGMILRNARSFVDAMLTGPPTVVFHGHRHVRYEGQLGDVIQVVSAPSTTLGDEATAREPGFAIFDVEPLRDGACLRRTRWVETPIEQPAATS